MIIQLPSFLQKLPTKKQLRAALLKLSAVERKIFVALCIVAAISGFGFLLTLNARFSIEVPREGGILKEGVVGAPNFINPLFATTESDKDLVELVYAGLMRRDADGNLVPVLAEKYERSTDGREYTFYLRKKLKWADGSPITADDVAFTITTAVNQTTRSAQKPNWEGIDIVVTDAYTIKFILKKPYAPFIANTTMGIIPQHVWGKFEPQELLGAQTNVASIVGAGPYKIQSVEKKQFSTIQKITLAPNKHFVLGKPLIKKVELQFFSSEQELRDAIKQKKVSAVGSLKNMADNEQTKNAVVQIPLPRIFAVFFNGNFVSRALQDKNVRSALELIIDKQGLVRDTLKQTGIPISGPIPTKLFGLLSDEDDAKMPADQFEKALKILDKAGWILNEETGVREKRFSKNTTAPLTFELVTINNPDMVTVAQFLQQSWKRAGINVEIKIFDAAKFEEGVFGPRKYDALLFGEVIGFEPDLFAFWHSSQRLSPGLNIALYANKKADSLVERIREEHDANARKNLLSEFIQEITGDVPATFLYTPLYTYVTPKNLKGSAITRLNAPSDRFSAIHAWFINTQKVWKVFAN